MENLERSAIGELWSVALLMRQSYDRKPDPVVLAWATLIEERVAAILRGGAIASVTDGEVEQIQLLLGVS